MMQNFIKFSLVGIYIICTLSKFEKAYAAYGLPTSTITLDLYRPNTSLVTILGLNVLQGVPFLTGNDLSNIRLHVDVTGY